MNARIAGTKFKRGLKRVDGVRVVALAAQCHAEIVDRVEIFGISRGGCSKFSGGFVEALLPGKCQAFLHQLPGQGFPRGLSIRCRAREEYSDCE
jgi:hypothetical protein